MTVVREAINMWGWIGWNASDCIEEPLDREKGDWVWCLES